MTTHGEDALPACDRIGADHGVNSFQFRPDVLGGPTRLVVEGESCLLGHLLEAGLLKGHGERLEELLIRLADPIVDLIARGPQRICSHIQHEQVIMHQVPEGKETYLLQW